MVDIFEILPIILEALIAVIALGIAVKKGKAYGYGFALTFLLYIVFDAARLWSWNLSSTVLQFLFLVATLSALWSMWTLYKTKK